MDNEQRRLKYRKSKGKVKKSEVLTEEEKNLVICITKKSKTRSDFQKKNLENSNIVKEIKEK